MATKTHQNRRPRRLIAWIVGALILAVLLIAARWTYWAFFTHRFTTVSEGRVYTTGSMTAEELKELVRTYGIRSVIDFRMPGSRRGMKADTEALVLEQLGVDYYRLPTDQVPDDSTVHEFLDIVGNHDVEPVLLQCAHGAGRSVLFAGIYRMEFEGWTNEQARDAAKRWFSSLGSFSPGSEKGDFLLNYVEDPNIGPRPSAEIEEQKK